MLRTFAAMVAAVALTAPALSAAAAPADVPMPPPPAPQAKMPHLRLHIAGAGAAQSANGSGTAFAAGIQGYSDVTPNVQWYWGASLWGVKVGPLVLPVTNGDVGVRFTPFNDWFIRPFVRANLGLSFLVILPVPNAGLAVGAMLPIFNTFFLEATLGGISVVNVFNINETINLGVFELGLGF